MNDSWPLVPLGEVLTQRKQFIQIDDLATYKRCRVQLHAQGVVLRDMVVGAEIKTKTQQVCQAGEFLVAEIDAKVGGYGIVPCDLEGAIVSSHYFLFRVDDTRLDRAFLDYFIRTPAFRDQVNAQGSTNYAAIRPSDVLGYIIPLPPLDEQRRIVARIEALAHRIEQARGLRHEAIAETEALLGASIDAEISRLYDAGCPETRVGDHEVLITSGPRNFSSRYNHSGVRFYRAQDIAANGHISEENTIWVESPDGMNTRAFVQAGDLLIVITGATIGRAAVVSETHPVGLVSQHVGLVRLNPQVIDSRFLHRCILAPSWTGRQVGETKYGQGKPGLNLNNLRELCIPFAPLEEQRRIVAYLDDVQARVDALKRLQAETAAELDALLPSVLDRAFRGEL